MVATLAALAVVGAGLLVYFTMFRKTTKKNKKTKK